MAGPDSPHHEQLINETLSRPKNLFPGAEQIRQHEAVMKGAFEASVRGENAEALQNIKDRLGTRRTELTQWVDRQRISSDHPAMYTPDAETQRQIDVLNALDQIVGQKMEIKKQAVEQLAATAAEVIVAPAAAPAVPPTAPTAAPVEAPRVQTLEYTIQRGDTLSQIAKRAGVSMDQIMLVNNIKNPDKIFAGQKLKLPTTNILKQDVDKAQQERATNVKEWQRLRDAKKAPALAEKKEPLPVRQPADLSNGGSMPDLTKKPADVAAPAVAPTLADLVRQAQAPTLQSQPVAPSALAAPPATPSGAPAVSPEAVRATLEVAKTTLKGDAEGVVALQRQLAATTDMSQRITQLPQLKATVNAALTKIATYTGDARKELADVSVTDHEGKPVKAIEWLEARQRELAALPN